MNELTKCRCSHWVIQPFALCQKKVTKVNYNYCKPIVSPPSAFYFYSFYNLLIHKAC